MKRVLDRPIVRAAVAHSSGVLPHSSNTGSMLPMYSSRSFSVLMTARRFLRFFRCDGTAWRSSLQRRPRSVMPFTRSRVALCCSASVGWLGCRISITPASLWNPYSGVSGEATSSSFGICLPVTMGAGTAAAVGASVCSGCAIVLNTRI